MAAGRARRASLAVACAMLVGLPALAEEPVTPDAAYATFTALKGAARSVMHRQDPPLAADCETALPLARRALEFLERADVANLILANGHKLADSRADIRIDLAQCAMVAHRNEQAMDLLQRALQDSRESRFVRTVLAEPLFAPLQADPRYVALAERAEGIDALWSAKAIATPFRERLTTEEKVAGLSLFWSEVRQNFVYIDRLGTLDWNAVYLQFLTRVMATDTTEDYYRVMMQLAPLLRDGHTNIYPPEALADRFYGAPPVGVARIDGQVVVTSVRSASLASRILVGDEITAIDGIPVQRYADERVRPFASASTPQDLELRTFTYQLLSGDERSPVELALRTKAGDERRIVLQRTPYPDLIAREPAAFRMLEGGIAYLPIASFESDDGVKALLAHLPEILSAKGLILDVRSNGGGDSRYGDTVLSYLTHEPIPQGTSTMRSEPGLLRAWNGPYLAWVAPPDPDGPVVIPHDRVFEGPVALLIGPRTFSAAEDFALSFDVLRRGRLYGSATGGSTGQPMMLGLPGGGSARICVRREAYPDGREFVGVGIQPTVAVSRTVDDLRAGRDPVLDRAAADLRATR